MAKPKQVEQEPEAKPVPQEEQAPEPSAPADPVRPIDVGPDGQRPE
jgi:hypothetical protein